MSDAYAAARGGADGVLCVSTLLTFASNWLAQHLGSFQIAHPSIAVRLDTSNRLVDFAREDIDVAIRSGGGKWPGVAAHMLFKADFTPMLSPRLAASIGGVKEPADLLRLPLLDPGDLWWKEWFAAAGVPTDELARRPGTSMGAQAYEANAAMAGHGVAILTARSFQGRACRRTPDPALRPGRRRRPCLLAGLSEARRNVPKIRAFRDWILAEIACQ